MGENAQRIELYTYQDYCRWPEDERWELIHGQAYLMSPAPSLSHQTISGDLVRQIANYLLDKPCRVFHAPFDVRLPQGGETDEQITTVVQPDIVMVCDERKLDKRGCRGAPDWIIEILSPATAARDQIQKLALYEQQGVKEYWIVHPGDRIVTVYRQEASGSYGRGRIAELQGELPVGVLPGLRIDWEMVVRKLPARVLDGDSGE
jgi:Uma2 family endonuclease